MHAQLNLTPQGAAMQAVVTDVPTCGAVQYAQQHSIPVKLFPAGSGLTTAPGAQQSALHSTEELVASLIRDKIDFVLLAGYLKLVPAAVVASFQQRMLNIHPGLLPAFGGKGMYGERVHRAAISSGCRCALSGMMQLC